MHVTARVFILVSSVVLLSGITPPATSVASIDSGALDLPPLSGAQVLEPMAGPAGLATAYSLAVRPVPPPPGFAAEGVQTTLAATAGVAGETPVPGCPVDLRAVVVGDGGRFAVLKIGHESRVARVGETLRFGGDVVRVSDISANGVTFLRGAVAVRCALSGSVTR